MKNVKGGIILGICLILGSLFGRACGKMMGQRYSLPRTISSPVSSTAKPTAHRNMVSQVMKELENNELVLLLLEKDPSFEYRLRKDLNNLLKDQKFVSMTQQKNQVLTIDMMLGRFPSLMEEIAKYLYKAPDEEFYNSFYLEYQHLKKNNCKIYPLPLDDQQETAKVKSQAVLAALKNPHAFSPLSEEQFSNLLEKIIHQYKAKGYDVSHFAIHWGMKPGKLAPNESCRVMKGIYESIFSLPKKEAILFWRMALYLGQEGN